LNLKPVLEIRDGIVTPVTRVRSRHKALAKVQELLQDQLGERDQIHMAVIKVAAPKEASHFAAELEAQFQPAEMVHAECGPVIGTHAGPGTVGVAYYVE
jgi:DegV family protein with EDD domain